MTNEELVSAYQETGERVKLEEICKQNERLIFMIVNDFRGIYAAESASRAAVIESDDLKQDGYIGLIQAVKNYDPERGAAFSTVALLYIRGAILRGLCDRGHTIRIPVHKREQLNRLRKFRSSYLAEYARYPKIDEISAFLGVGGQEVEELLKIEIRANMESLNKSLSDDPDGRELCDTIPDSRDRIEEAEDSIFRDQVKEKLWGAVDELEEVSSAVLHGYFQDEKTLREIGESLNISTRKAEQVKSKALEQLRRGRFRREIVALAKEYELADGVSFKGVSVGTFQRTGMSATERAAFLRLEASRAARVSVMKGAATYDKFIGAGLTYSQRNAYYEMIDREKRKEGRAIMARLKEEF